MQIRATCLIILTSVAASLAAIFNAYVQKRQFYPSVVYLTKSNASLAVLYAQSLVLVYLLAQTARRLFFGQLRAAE
uniref:E3 ubiquitin-protein ligase synoviolin-like TPR repeats domain-containing protein n=1 Tax=Romanomermis culicivorax TaxID=13658 RepID=A0A915IE98_ROMCU